MRKLAFAGAFAAAGVMAQAQWFDFEDADIGIFPSVSQTIDGTTVTATAIGGDMRVINAGGLLPTFGTRSLVGNTTSAPYFPIRFDFSTLVTSFSVDGADGGNDEDGNLIASVYDLDGNLLQVLSAPAGNGSTVTALTYSGLGASYFIMTTDGQIPNSMTYDNVRIFATAVPGPAAAIPFALGMLARRRRRR